MRTTIGIAIDIPEPWGSELTRHRAAAGDPAASQIPAHLTLLGPTEVSGEDLEAVDRHLAAVAAGAQPFPLHLRGTGTFRPLTEVVYVRVIAGAAECERLAAAVRELPAVDRPPRYPYHPHVTVAQEVPAEALDAVSAALAGFDAKFTVVGFTLFRHEPDGHWRSQREYRLGDGVLTPDPPPTPDRPR